MGSCSFLENVSDSSRHFFCRVFSSISTSPISAVLSFLVRMVPKAGIQSFIGILRPVVDLHREQNFSQEIAVCSVGARISSWTAAECRAKRKLDKRLPAAPLRLKIVPHTFPHNSEGCSFFNLSNLAPSRERMTLLACQFSSGPLYTRRLEALTNPDCSCAFNMRTL